MRLVTCLSLCAFILILLACGGVPDATTAASRPRSREELKAILVGKSRDAVRRELGKPDDTNTALGSEYWGYRDRSYDPVSQSTDHSVTVWFHADKDAVQRITFSSR